MIGTWPIVQLRDHVTTLTGFPFKSQQFSKNPEDVPLVKGENLHQRYIDWAAARRWPAIDLETYRKYQLQPGDVVLAMDRPWIEAGLKWAWIKPHDPQALLVQRVARLRGRNGLLTNYLRYVIDSPNFTDYIRPIVTGVNVPHISAAQMRRITFLSRPSQPSAKSPQSSPLTTTSSKTTPAASASLRRWRRRSTESGP